MRFPVAEAVQLLEARGALGRHRRDQFAKVIDYVRGELGRDVPADLADFYAERVDSVGDFQAIYPVWNDWGGWRQVAGQLTCLLQVDAIPIFWDGCGSLFGLDLSSGAETPAVYLFDKDDLYAKPRWAAGSSLGTFLLLLADHDRSYAEHWPTGWELKIDPDLDRCPRARAIWNAG